MSTSVPLGSIIYTAVKPILKIYFIVGFGVLLGKRNVLTVQSSRTISDLVVSLLLPSLVYNKIVTNIQNSDIKQIGIIVMICITLFGFGAIFAILSHYITRGPRYWRGGCIMVGLCPNISDLPIAYMTTFASGLVFSEQEGDKGIAYICIFTMVQIFMQFNLGCFKLIGWDFDVQFKEQDIEIRSTRSRSSSVSTHHTTQSLRRQPSQSIHDVITEYSEVSRMKTGNIDDKAPSNDSPKSWYNIPKAIMLFFWDNFTKPLSMACLIGIIVAMIPWLRALFVESSQVSLPSAPDSFPPLSFVMDFTGYLGDSCVPLGLLILGATLSRLEINSIWNWSIWSTPSALTFVRLILMPILGVLINTRLSTIGWYDDDKMLQFICTLVFGLPNATSLIYLTAFYTPLEGEYKQMDYLALTYILEYPILAISLPFLTTYTVKVCLGM